MMTRLRSRDHVVPSVLAALTLSFHLLTTAGYGYFRDELYYLANGQHLSFGYVDHPPLIGVISALIRSAFGTSLFAIRLLPAVAGAMSVWLTAASARELGGQRRAQALAGLAAMLAPVLVSLFSILSMNAFDVLAWATCYWLLIRILATDDQRLWLVFGVVAGLGLENKLSVLFLCFGIGVGLLFGGRWAELRSRWFWIGAATAGLLLVPYVAWQASHGWLLLEFMHNAREQKNVSLSPWQFMFEQVLIMGPLAAPVWIAGLVFFLVAREAKPFRAVGWSYVVVLLTFIASGNAKPYYLAPAYAPLFAGGGVFFERLVAWKRGWLIQAAAATLVVVGGLLALPLAKPLLAEERFAKYAALIGLQPSAGERHALGRLPQFFADMHGWPQLAEDVARVFHSLSSEDQARACIFGQNYGQAGAIDLFGPPLGLPRAISAHNSYWVWGPGECRGDVLLVIGDDRERLEALFKTIELGATHTCQDCMPYENHQPIWIARGLRSPIGELWPQLRKLI
jgi:MFS family permease